MSKSGTLMLIALLVLSGLVMVGSVCAQSVPAPSTPTFTVTFLGRNMNNSGMNNTHIQVTINNPPLPANLDKNKYSIYYRIRYNHSSYYINRQVGGGLNKIDNSLSPDPTEASITWELQNAIPAQLNSPNTTYIIETDKNFNLYAGDQIDVQVKAVIGHNFTRWYIAHPIIQSFFGPRTDFDTEVLTDRPAITPDSESNWSETQTLTIPTPVEPASILGIVAFLAVFVFGVVLLYRIKKK